MPSYSIVSEIYFDKITEFLCFISRARLRSDYFDIGSVRERLSALYSDSDVNGFKRRDALVPGGICAHTRRTMQCFAHPLMRGLEITGCVWSDHVFYFR